MVEWNGGPMACSECNAQLHTRADAENHDGAHGDKGKIVPVKAARTAAAEPQTAAAAPAGRKTDEKKGK